MGGRSRAVTHGLQGSTKAPSKRKSLLKKKRRKLIERPDYLTEDKWEEARRAAKEAKP
jgi:hypothetical protein